MPSTRYPAQSAHTRWCQKKYKCHILKSSKKNDAVGYHHTQHRTQKDFKNVDTITQEKN